MIGQGGGQRFEPGGGGTIQCWSPLNGFPGGRLCRPHERRPGSNGIDG
jgi:hypothetical protein